MNPDSPHFATASDVRRHSQGAVQETVCCAGVGAGVVVIILITGLAVACGRTFTIAVAVVQQSISTMITARKIKTGDREWMELNGFVISCIPFTEMGNESDKNCEMNLKKNFLDIQMRKKRE
jgi:uncharacterized membrane protein YedE/YeeE